MAEVLQQNTYQRGLSEARESARRETASADSSNTSQESEDIDPLAVQEEQSQNFLRRRLSMLRGRGQEEQSAKGANVLQKQAEEKIKKELAKKLTWRALNIAMGASVILLFVTIIIWTVQFIGGNMMGSKLIPKLGLGEIILWLIGLAIMVALFNMIVLAITLMIEVFEKPGNLLGDILNIFWKDFWSGLVGS